MSDTSIISTYDDEIRRNSNRNQHSLFCNRYWFNITTILLLIIIIILYINRLEIATLQGGRNIIYS